MRRTMVAFLVGALLVVGGQARADDEPCNLKAVRHAALHQSRATDPDRIDMLRARYERLVARCSAPPPHG
jgi:hypothetical protein